MNDTEAKLILMLNQLEARDRNIFHLTAKLNKSYSAVYNYVRILKEKKVLSCVTSNGKTFYSVADPNAIVEAKERLSVN
tara:strand:- start:475 stop:711 length:237 start_codon:yes stop_codon:yes gene_type:complete